jgi:hypothetical protein
MFLLVRDLRLFRLAIWFFRFGQKGGHHHEQEMVVDQRRCALGKR